MKNIIRIITILMTICSFGQNGVIKGKIIDKQSEVPLIGATVSIANSTNLIAVSDESGSFMIENVPLRRQAITVTYMGYMPTSIPNIEVTSGKDVFLIVTLTENYNSLDEVVIKAETNKAIDCAKYHGLYSNDTKVMIEEVTLNLYEECQ